MAFREIKKAKSGLRPTSDPRGVTVARSNNETKSEWTSRRIVRITLGVDLLREARYVIGDRLVVHVDTDGPQAVCLVSRVLNTNGEQGWKLTSASSSGKEGTFARGTLQFTVPENEIKTFFHNGVDRYNAQNISVKDEGILFDLE